MATLSKPQHSKEARSSSSCSSIKAPVSFAKTIGVDTQFSLLFRGNHDILIDLVLAKIGTPNWNYQDQQGCSTLHFAASGGSDRAVNMILKSDVDIDLPDTCGWTPLHWACRSGSHKTVQMLKDFGADSNRKDMKGWTPLDVAVFCRNDSLADLLQDETNRAEPKQFITRPGKRQYCSCSSCYHVSHAFTRLYATAD
jgi:hypothetical protein